LIFLLIGSTLISRVVIQKDRKVLYAHFNGLMSEQWIKIYLEKDHRSYCK